MMMNFAFLEIQADMMHTYAIVIMHCSLTAIYSTTQ